MLDLGSVDFNSWYGRTNLGLELIFLQRSRANGKEESVWVTVEADLPCLTQDLWIATQGQRNVASVITQ